MHAYAKKYSKERANGRIQQQQNECMKQRMNKGTNEREKSGTNERLRMIVQKWDLNLNPE